VAELWHNAGTMEIRDMTAACSNHQRDSLGWPLGNCPACVAYRAKMDAWYLGQVLAGIAKPDLTPVVEQRENGDGL